MKDAIEILKHRKEWFENGLNGNEGMIRALERQLQEQQDIIKNTKERLKEIDSAIFILERVSDESRNRNANGY